MEDRQWAASRCRESAYLAFHVGTGELAWKSGSDVAAYSSPIAITVGGVRQVVFFSGGGLRAISPGDGRVLWEYPWQSRCPATGVALNAASPIHIPPDRIFISSGYSGDRGAAVIRIIHEGEMFHAEPVWRNEVLETRINSAVLLDDRLYGFHGGILKAIDAGTGTELWKARGFQRGSVIGADGKLIVLGEEGNLALVEATGAAYREISSAQLLSARSWTPPSLAGGRLYLRSVEELLCLAVAGTGTGS
jgi:outer membrane protein assembly factor BamB